MPPKGRSKNDYQNKTSLEHVRDVPDTYIGSIEPRVISEWIFDFETEQMKKVEMDLSAGVKRVFLEILSNAGDNVRYSFSQGINPGRIDFTFDQDGYLSIRNGGSPIPIEPHLKSTKDNLHLIPTDIFSVLYSSTNYDTTKDRIGAGRNGYGSKLTNCFSSHFIVMVGDSGRVDDNNEPISGQEYIGEWRDQMKIMVKAEAIPGFSFKDGEWKRLKRGSYRGPAYTEVSWHLDFVKMNIPDEKYSINDLGLFSRYILEFSLTCGVPVTINKKLYDFRSIRKFASLFYEKEKIKTAVSYFCSGKAQAVPDNFKNAKTTSQRESIVAEGEYEPESQILLLDTPDDGHIFSYVNGLLTSEGGVHVEKLFKELSPIVIKAIQERSKNSTSGLLKPKDVKPHLSIFLVCRVLNTKYNSQSKTKLESPTPNITFSIDDVKPLLAAQWALSERLLNTIDAKNIKNLSRTDGKKLAHISLDKGEDANEAGKAKSSQCRLYIVEGKSATSYPRKRIKCEKGGKDFGGFYPLQGKPMNVSSHDEEKVNANKEFENIKKMLGLRHGADYSSDEMMKTLRYGEVILTTDADSDGMHILGLIINLFHKYWPSLMAKGFVRFLATPVVRAFVQKGKGEETMCFYDERSFVLWHDKQKSLPGSHKMEIKYYKGLGSSEDDDIKADLKTAPIVVLDYDNEGKRLVDLAFHKDKSDERKEWIQKWREIRGNVKLFSPTGILEHRTISDVMGISFPPYMIDNLFRSIPSYKDGLKKSQRQAMYYALHHWNYGKKYVEKEKTGTKVAAIALKAADYVNYHHNHDSMTEAIVKMTQKFTGSNNLPYFKDHGQFGTRDAGGKDAASPRYIGLSCPWWMSYLYQQEMIDLISRRDVDGDLGEPLWLPCDLPLGIINGGRGVGTGWSTYIPSHHPLQIADWILDRLDGNQPSPLLPYFHGFKGKLIVKTKLPLKKDETDTPTITASDDDEDESSLTSYCGRGMTTLGKYEILSEKKNGTVDVRVTELPVYTWSKDYRKWVEKLLSDKKIEGFRDLSVSEDPDLIIEGLPTSMATSAKLGLEKSYGLTNMVLIDDDGVPTLHRSVEEIVSLYMDEMLKVYEQLKGSRLTRIMDKIEEMIMERKIIQAYLDDKLIIKKGTTDKEIDSQLLALSLSQEIFDKINLRGLTHTKILLLEKRIEEKRSEYKSIKETPVQRLWKNRIESFKKEFIKRKVYSESLDEALTIQSQTISRSAFGNNMRSRPGQAKQGLDIYQRVEVDFF